MTGRKILDINKHVYLFMKSKIDISSSSIETVMQNLKLILKIGKFAWRNHPGCFFDAEIENLLLRYGRELEVFVDTKKISSEINKLFHNHSENTTLHIATEIGGVGGHTRVIKQMIRRSKEQNQAFLLTSMKIDGIPDWFDGGVKQYAKIISLSKYLSPLEKAYALRMIAKRFSKIILYHHPFDITLILAFAKKGSIPVVIENHAHSWFWFGNSIADMIFSHTSFHKKFTEKYREIKNSYYLPFTQADNIENIPKTADKQKAKELLGIDSNATVVLTVASREKFIPNAQYNYFEIAEKILQNNPHVIFIILGLAKNDILVKEIAKNKRVIFHEYIKDLTNYYLASDICLEAMPQPSLGVQLLAPMIGLCTPFPKFGKSKVFKSHTLHHSMLYHAHFQFDMTEEEFYKKFNLFLNDQELRISVAKDIRNLTSERSSAEKLYSNLNKMYKKIELLTHVPIKLKKTTFYDNEENIEIADRSELQSWTEILHYWGAELDNTKLFQFMKGNNNFSFFDSSTEEEQLDFIFSWNNLREERKLNAELEFGMDNLTNNRINKLKLEQKRLRDAEELIKTNNLEEAKSILNYMLKECGSNIDVLNDLAVVYIMEENYDLAVSVIAKVLSIDPYNEIANGNIEYLESVTNNV